jgi:copper chaperone CopZ
MRTFAVTSHKEMPVMKTTLRSQQLNCPSCVVKIEKALGARKGVENAKVHFATGRIDVEHDETQIPRDELVKVVRSAGYESRVSPF